jgi:hypothetical protein
MKVDMYALESQFVYALGRAVRECTALKKDEKGRIAGLADEPEKVKVIRELLRKADLKQRTEMRIKLYPRFGIAGGMGEGVGLSSDGA